MLGIVCGFTGRYTAYLLEMRVVLLEKIIVMLTMIENEVQYFNRPVQEIFTSLCSCKELKKLQFVFVCNELMENGETFAHAWETAIDSRSCVRFLKKDDVSVLRSFGEIFGTTDVDGQISNCRVHLRLAEDKLSNARQSKEKYSSLFCGLGALTGIGVFIILV